MNPGGTTLEILGGPLHSAIAFGNYIKSELQNSFTGLPSPKFLKQ